MKRFLVCSGVTFALALAFLLWLGPVWIYDVEDRIVAFFGAIFIYVFILAVLAGGVVEVAADAAIQTVANVAAAAVETGIHGSVFLRRLTRGAGPAIAGTLLGTVVALGAMWGLAHSSTMRMTYARARPERALAGDFVRVAAFLDVHKKARKAYPRDAGALGVALREAGVELRYSSLRNGVWTDPWDRPFFYEARKGLMSWTVQAYSFGANGQDDGGKPDDLSIAETLSLWKKLIRRLDTALKDDPK